MEVFLSSLLQPLRSYALEHLSAQFLALLRGANTTAQLLVDQHTGSIWKAAASVLLNPTCLPDAEHANAVQSTLRDQAALLHHLRTGVHLGPLHALIMHSQRQASFHFDLSICCKALMHRHDVSSHAFPTKHQYLQQAGYMHLHMRAILTRRP